MKETFGEFIRARRLDAGLTQQALGEAIGYAPKVAQTRVSEIENDKKYPDAGLRRELSRALGVSHVGLLIAAGELQYDEVPIEGEPRPIVRPTDPRAPSRAGRRSTTGARASSGGASPTSRCRRRSARQRPRPPQERRITAPPACYNHTIDQPAVRSGVDLDRASRDARSRTYPAAYSLHCDRDGVRRSGDGDRSPTLAALRVERRSCARRERRCRFDPCRVF